MPKVGLQFCHVGFDYDLLVEAPIITCLFHFDTKEKLNILYSKELKKINFKQFLISKIYEIY